MAENLPRTSDRLTRRSLLATLAAAPLAPTVLAACSAGKGVDTGGSGGGGAGGFVAAISAQPDQLDPHKTTAYASFQVLENVYDTLVVPSGDDLSMGPSLATDWTTSEDGLTTVLKAGDKFEVVAENDIKEYCLSSVAISDGQIFLRGDKNLYCIGKRLKK